MPLQRNSQVFSNLCLVSPVGLLPYFRERRFIDVLVLALDGKDVFKADAQKTLLPVKESFFSIVVYYVPLSNNALVLRL